MEIRMPNHYVEMSNDEMMYTDGGGFVGLHIRISKGTGTKNAWAASLAAGAASVAVLATMTAAGGPLGVAASFLGGGLVQRAVYEGVSSGKLFIPIGVNIPLVSWVRTIRV